MSSKKELLMKAHGVYREENLAPILIPCSNDERIGLKTKKKQPQNFK